VNGDEERPAGPRIESKHDNLYAEEGTIQAGESRAECPSSIAILGEVAAIALKCGCSRAFLDSHLGAALCPYSWL